MTDINDRRAASSVVGVISRVAERVVSRTVPVVRIGVVAAVDRSSRTADVVLNGGSAISAGFVFGAIVPRADDLVRVVLDPTGGRYVDAVLGRDLVAPPLELIAALPMATSSDRGRLVLLRGAAGVADVVYVCRKDAADAYGWAAL